MGNEQLAMDVWNQKWTDLFIDLLHLVSQFLGYEFNRVEISKEIYAPKGHAVIESDQEIIRRGLAGIFSGKYAIPIDVKSFPTDPEAAKEQEEMRKSILKWLNGNTAVGVEIMQGNKAK